MGRKSPFRLAGVQVGEVRALARCEDRVTLKGRKIEQWLCRCSCGALTKRTKARLIRAFWQGENVACSACNRETHRGLWIDMHRRNKVAFRSLWQTYGLLYSARSIGLVELPEDAGVEASDPKPEPMRRRDCPDSQQRAIYLYPINLGDDRTIQCIECGEFVSDCFGCVICLEAVCIDCVRKESHRHPSESGCLTLEKVGMRFNCTRENVRRIETLAAESLKRSWKRSFERVETRCEQLDEAIDRANRKPPLPRPMPWPGGREEHAAWERWCTKEWNRTGRPSP